MKQVLMKKLEKALTLVTAAVYLLFWLLVLICWGSGMTLVSGDIVILKVIAVALAAVSLLFAIWAAGLELRFSGKQKMNDLYFAAAFLGLSLVTGRWLPAFGPAFTVCCGAVLMVLGIILYKLSGYNQKAFETEKMKVETTVPEAVNSSTVSEDFKEEKGRKKKEAVTEAEAPETEPDTVREPDNREWRQKVTDALGYIGDVDGQYIFIYNETDRKYYFYSRVHSSIMPCGGDNAEMINGVPENRRPEIRNIIENGKGNDEITVPFWFSERSAYRESIVRIRRKKEDGVTLIFVTDIDIAVTEDNDTIARLKDEIQRYKELAENSNSEEQRIFFAVSELMSDLVEKRSDESYFHIQAVCEFSNLLLRKAAELYPELDLNSEFLSKVRNAAILHDIGKIQIPDAILKKQGRLTPEEFAEMKAHTTYGAEIINRMPYINGQEDTIHYAYEIALSHHERADGKGYPNGLKEEDIPFYVQAVGLADCFEALTAKRAYKDPLDPRKAFEMINNGDCGAFSEKLLKCMNECRDEMIRVRIELQDN